MSNVSATISSINVYKLIELLNTADDYETHVKIFSVLAMYLVNKRGSSYSDVIYTCKPLYEKIRQVLNKNLPIKTARTLNFISALLYIEDKEKELTRKKSLVVYAQNIIRTSGCLLEMCNMFSSCMMHQETWIALCRCLAECCNNSKANQSYCSHLIPLGVKKCVYGNEDVVLTLRSLLNNHENNTQLFLKSNGITMFRRELLQYENCMQLLDTFIQNLTEENLSLLPASLNQSLKYYQNIHGANTRIGQWASIILHRIDGRHLKDHYFKNDNDKNNKENSHPNKPVENDKSPVFDDYLLRPSMNDTSTLLQNIIKEINQNKMITIPHQREKFELENSRTKLVRVNRPTLPPVPQTTRSPLNITARSPRRTVLDTSSEKTFSFLLQLSSQNVSQYKNLKLQRTGDTLKTNLGMRMQKIFGNNIPSVCEIGSQRYKESQRELVNSDEPSLLDFKPVFVSTPKHNNQDNTIVNLTKYSPLSRFSQRTFKNTKRRKFFGRGSYNVTEKSKINLKNRSLSSRFFNAINSSCTTFVKTVSKIFKPIKNEEKHKTPTSPSDGESPRTSCSYSFTDYMRKRDAVLADEWTTQESQPKENTNTCKTCNDTTTLKNKVFRDNYLKNSIKKLKLGINIYGCDFKKIAKTMWPHEAYMTPEVLYNLYRKIIFK